VFLFLRLVLKFFLSDAVIVCCKKKKEKEREKKFMKKFMKKFIYVRLNVKKYFMIETNKTKIFRNNSPSSFHK